MTRSEFNMQPRPWYRDWRLVTPFLALAFSVGALVGSLAGQAV